MTLYRLHGRQLLVIAQVLVHPATGNGCTARAISKRAKLEAQQQDPSLS